MWVLVLLRIAIGWHFLFEGLSKLFTPGWTAAEYLATSRWIFAPIFHWMVDTPAVLNAVDNGQLSAERYQNYIKINKETAYNEMSNLEKMKKDKQFGKFIKTFINNKKKPRKQIKKKTTRKKKNRSKIKYN